MKVSKQKQIHPSEYASNNYWKNDFLHKTTYKRGSFHNKVGMVIMWAFYSIVIVQVLHAISIIPFFPITFLMLLFGAYILFQGWIAR